MGAASLPPLPRIPPAEKMKASPDVRLFRLLMLISKIKDLYHLIELTSSTHTELEGWGWDRSFLLEGFEWERGWIWGTQSWRTTLQLIGIFWTCYQWMINLGNEWSCRHFDGKLKKVVLINWARIWKHHLHADWFHIPPGLKQADDQLNMV